MVPNDEREIDQAEVDCIASGGRYDRTTGECQSAYYTGYCVSDDGRTIYPADPFLGCWRGGRFTQDKGYDGYDPSMASGGIVKRKTKKYQMGGIADLTRDARFGAAVNPADGYNFGFAAGGMAAMPEYQAGGKLLRGPGDGMSDDIPAVIRGKGVQRAALADGEFVIPADVVSHLGNGSTDAGAKKLYKMMEQIRRARTGRGKQAPQVNADKFLPRVTPSKKRR